MDHQVEILSDIPPDEAKENEGVALDEPKDVPKEVEPLAMSATEHTKFTDYHWSKHRSLFQEWNQIEARWPQNSRSPEEVDFVANAIPEEQMSNRSHRVDK